MLLMGSVKVAMFPRVRFQATITERRTQRMSVEITGNLARWRSGLVKTCHVVNSRSVGSNKVKDAEY